MATEITAADKFLQGFDDLELKGVDRMPLISEYLGTHKVTLVNAKINESTNPKTKGKVFFKADVDVNSSTNDALKPGTRVSILLMADGFGYYHKDLAYLTGAILQEDPKTVKTQSIMGVVSEEQPAKGAEFVVIVNPPKKEGSTFNRTLFRAVGN